MSIRPKNLFIPCIVEPRSGWRPPKFYVDDVWDSGDEPPRWPCPLCEAASLFSFHYSFERDTIAFKCPHCGVIEVKYE